MIKGKIRVAETGEELVIDVLDDVVEEYALKKQPKADTLEACLKAYTKKNLLKLADENDFDVKKSWTKDPIIDFMSEEIMGSLEENLSELDEGALNVLQAIANGRSRDEFSEDEAEIYASVYPKAVRMGLLYLADEDGELITTMPAEVQATLDEVVAGGSDDSVESDATDVETDKSEETEETATESTAASESDVEVADGLEAQINQVLKAGIHLYGILTLQMVKDLFAIQYPDAEYSEEIVTDLIAKQGYLFVDEHLIANPLFDSANDVQDRYEERKDKMGEQYYQPMASEIDYYAEHTFDRRSFLYKSLKRFVSPVAVNMEKTMARIELGLTLGEKPALVVGNLVEDGMLNIGSDKQITEILHSYVNVHNITRMWGNAGYTPKEMADELGISEQVQTFNPAAVPETEELPIEDEKFEDVGRNDPCPCGSGKKYKKCHMKKNRS